MNKSLEYVFSKINSDKNLMEKFALCKTKEEQYSLALNIMDGYTLEEFLEAQKSVYTEAADKICANTKNKNLKKLAEELVEDYDLKSKLCNMTNVEEQYKLALTVVDGYTFDEFKKFLGIQDGIQMLSEDELDEVSGGTDVKKVGQATMAALSGALVQCVRGHSQSLYYETD